MPHCGVSTAERDPGEAGHGDPGPPNPGLSLSVVSRGRHDRHASPEALGRGEGGWAGMEVKGGSLGA